MGRTDVTGPRVGRLNEFINKVVQFISPQGSGGRAGNNARASRTKENRRCVAATYPEDEGAIGFWLNSKAAPLLPSLIELALAADDAG